MKQPRILMTIGSARAGGAEGQMIRLGCELTARGAIVRFVFSEAGGSLTGQLDAAGVPWSIARRSDWPKSSTLRRILGIVRLAVTIVRFRPTAVVAWLPTAIWPALLLSRALAPRAIRLAGIRGEIFDDQLGWQRPFLREALRSAHVVTVNSPHLAQVARRWGVSQDRVCFLPNGVDLPPAVADVATEPPVGVVVANYRWYKGQDTLIRALALMDRPPVLRLCGSGDPREHAALAKDLGVDQQVVFVPEPADVPNELGRAQFAVHPSTQEGLSNAILEELSTGLPVVATDVGGTPLLVEDGVTGFLVPHSEPAELAIAMARVVNDAPLRQQMAIQARSHASGFSWASCADNYVDLFARYGVGFRCV